ncbi:M24 family metallopeptidase, partial [Arthrospira platensis SPKY1]|nr:M24 family metallopeptidase [Arthrospira platensis SPKY1]
TERHAAKLMKTWLLDHGVDDWFHQPFAWFGDRTAFRGFSGFNPRFYPSGRALELGMPYILDCAPVMGGAVADIGYSGCLGDNEVQERLMDNLAQHRDLILELIRRRESMAEVSRAVDRLCQQQGVEPRHKAYPFS